MLGDESIASQLIALNQLQLQLTQLAVGCVWIGIKLQPESGIFFCIKKFYLTYCIYRPSLLTGPQQHRAIAISLKTLRIRLDSQLLSACVCFNINIMHPLLYSNSPARNEYSGNLTTSKRQKNAIINFKTENHVIT